MQPVQNWKSELYDDQLGFVSEFGKGVVDLLGVKEGERILDLGCGTGDLADELHKRGARVTGLDMSQEMVERARAKYPGIRFVAGNAEDFSLDERFDAVFSNAALHWMKQPEQVLACVWNSLNDGGRFVAELGGKGNVETIVKAVGTVLAEDYGIDAAPLIPWYFPSIAEYSILLERQGFRVMYAAHFDRATSMNGGEDGLHHWLDSFADNFFRGFAAAERKRAYERIAAICERDLFYDGRWNLDYKRLRVAAVKP